jgi:hypothetical protein
MTTLADFMEPSLDDDAMVMKPFSMIEPRAFDALKTVKGKDRILQGEDGERRVIERTYEITLHDPMKAVQMIADRWGSEAVEFMKAGTAEAGSKKARGIQLDLRNRSRTFTHQDRQGDFKTKTDEEWEAELLGDR